MRRAFLHMAGAALVCAGFSALVVVSAHGRDVAGNTLQTIKTAERVVPLARQGRLPAVLPGDRAEATQVLDTSGRVIASTAQLTSGPPMASFRPGDQEMSTGRDLCPPAGLRDCMTVVAMRFSMPPGDGMVYAARPTVPVYGDGTLIVALGGLCALIAGVTGVGTYWLVGRTLAPMAAIRGELAEITATGFDRRVPVPANPAEVRSLAETVNTTLDRLEAAHERLRRFASDASHDLRSPITAIRIQLEEALMYPDDTRWQATAGSVLRGVERLQALVSDLLALARLDSGVPLACEETDLTEMITCMLDQRPPKKKITRDLEPDVRSDCDRLRICRVMTNLLDNAERHARSQITVILRATGPMAVLEVIDDGAGIAAEQREKVFQRFTRLKESRDLDPEGTGLGLAIGRQIAEAHGGTLTIQDAPCGARLVLCLPRRGPTSSPAAP